MTDKADYQGPPEYAPRLDVSGFGDTHYGHRPDCHMLTAYDNDGCDCAWLLLREVRRLSAINRKLVESHNSMLVRGEISFSAIGFEQVGQAFVGPAGQAIGAYSTVSLVNGEPIYRAAVDPSLSGAKEETDG